MPQVVLDQQTGKDVLYPDNIHADEIDRSIGDLVHGTITDAHPSWIDKHILQPLHQNGVDLPNLPMMFQAVKGGFEEGLQPIIPFNIPKPTREQKLAYSEVSPGSYMLGNLVGAVPAFAALEAGTEGAGALLPVLSKAPALAKIWQASKFGAVTGAYGGLSSASEQKQQYGDIDWHEVGKQILKQGTIGLAGGTGLEFLSKPLSAIGAESAISGVTTRAITTGGVMAGMAAASGASPRDVVLSGGFGMILGGLHEHGGSPEVRKSAVDEAQNLTAKYIKSQLNVRDDIAHRIAREHLMNEAQNVIDAQEEKAPEEAVATVPVVKGFSGETNDPIHTVLESPQMTMDFVTNLTKQASGMEGDTERGLSKSVESTAIKEGMVKEFKDMPTYAKRNMEEASAKASEFIESNYDLAKKIAFGEAPEQGGIRAQELFTGLRLKAMAEGDVATLRELAMSPATGIATELGQRIKALDSGEHTVVDRIKEVKDSREANMKKSRSVPKEIRSIKEHIGKQKPKIKDWDDFLKEIAC